VAGAKKYKYNTKYNTNTYNANYMPPSGVFSFPDEGKSAYCCFLLAGLACGLRTGTTGVAHTMDLAGWLAAAQQAAAPGPGALPGADRLLLLCLLALLALACSCSAIRR
jgi:hypothetical protein